MPAFVATGFGDLPDSPTPAPNGCWCAMEPTTFPTTAPETKYLELLKLCLTLPVLRTPARTRTTPRPARRRVSTVGPRTPGARSGHCEVSLEEVRANFRRYGLLDGQVHFLEGWFRDTLPSAPIDQLAVLRIDGDLYEIDDRGAARTLSAARGGRLRHHRRLRAPALPRGGRGVPRGVRHRRAAGDDRVDGCVLAAAALAQIRGKDSGSVPTELGAARP